MAEEEDVGRKVLLRFLFLALVLDKANSEGRLEWRHEVGLEGFTLPLLFRTHSPIRSSTAMLGVRRQPGTPNSPELPPVSLTVAFPMLSSDLNGEGEG